MSYLVQRGVKCCSHKFNGNTTEKKIHFILKKVANVDPDIFVPNLSVAGWFASRWVREAGIPTIAAQRSDDAFHWAMVDEFVTGDPEWAVSGLICVSESLFQKVRSRKPKHTKLCVIPSGVPVHGHISEQQGPLRLVYVGRLVQESKRILELIDGLSLVIGEHSEISAYLIGDGPERQAVQQRIDHYNLNDRVQILGNVPSEDIQAKLAQYHVLVLLSDYEGTPGAVMDGMAVGLVPVCLDIPGGVRELVIHEDTGLLVTDRKNAFADAIGRLADDEALRRRLSVNARAHIIKQYSLHIAADRWEKFCLDILKESNERKPLTIPSKLLLPPVRPGLDREDRRKVSLPVRIVRTSAQIIRRTLTRIFL